MFNQYAVIFDMDGVLADTGPVHFESWVKMTSEIGVEFTKEFFEQIFGQQSPEIIKKLMGPNVNEITIEKLANLKEKYYRDMVKDQLKPLPGVIELIKELYNLKFKLAVGSSGPSENVELLLTSLKIKKYFNAVITAAEIKRGKPEPDVFLEAAKRVKVKQSQCVVIEDAPVGIESAKRAGMKCIALTTTHPEKELFNADLIVKDLSEITSKDVKKLLNIEWSELIRFFYV